MVSSCNSWLMFSQKLQEKTWWDFQTIFTEHFFDLLLLLMWLFYILRQISAQKHYFWLSKALKSEKNVKVQATLWRTSSTLSVTYGLNGPLIFQFWFLFQQQSSKKDYHLKLTWCLFVEKEFKRQNNLWPKWLSEHWTITPPTPSLSHTHTYSVFHQFRQAKFANGGSI